MDTFESLLQSSAAAHGHLCPGQVVGVRMAMLGCRLIGLDEPTRHDQIKKLIVYVEMDRCTADAVAYVTVDSAAAPCRNPFRDSPSRKPRHQRETRAGHGATGCVHTDAQRNLREAGLLVVLTANDLRAFQFPLHLGVDLLAGELHVPHLRDTLDAHAVQLLGQLRQSPLASGLR